MRIANRDITLIGHEFEVHFAKKLSAKARGVAVLATEDFPALARMRSSGDLDDAFLWEDFDKFTEQARADLGTHSIINQGFLTVFTGLESRFGPVERRKQRSNEV